METGELAKLILFSAIAISCLGISYQLARLISAVVDLVRDARQIIVRLNTVVDGLVRSQSAIQEGIENVLKIFKKINKMVDMLVDGIVKPVTAIFSFLKVIDVYKNKIGRKFGKD